VVYKDGLTVSGFVSQDAAAKWVAQQRELSTWYSSRVDGEVIAHELPPETVSLKRCQAAEEFRKLNEKVSKLEAFLKLMKSQLGVGIHRSFDHPETRVLYDAIHKLDGAAWTACLARLRAFFGFDKE